MIKIFVLVVVTYVHGGSTVTFQEFNSLAQCNYVRDYAAHNSSRIYSAACFEK